MADYRNLRRKVSELKGQLSELQAQEEAKKTAEHMAEFERLKKLELDMKAKAKEDAREAIRRRNVDAVLSDVPADRRKDVEIFLAGMQATEQINLYDEAEGAGLRLRGDLGKSRPDWFSVPSNGGVGLPGAPGQGLPSGPLIGLSPEEYLSLSDEAKKAHFQRAKPTGANP